MRCIMCNYLYVLSCVVFNFFHWKFDETVSGRHLLVEFQMDLFQLLDRRQPQPRAGHGLPEALTKSDEYWDVFFGFSWLNWMPMTPLTCYMFLQYVPTFHEILIDFMTFRTLPRLPQSSGLDGDLSVLRLRWRATRLQNSAPVTWVTCSRHSNR